MLDRGLFNRKKEEATSIKHIYKNGHEKLKERKLGDTATKGGGKMALQC